MYIVHGRGADLPAFWPQSYIGTDKSAAWSGATLRHMHSRYLPNSISLIENLILLRFEVIWCVDFI